MPMINWLELHGAMTHIPVAFLLMAPLFDIGAIVLRKPEWRTVSFWMLVAAVVVAVPSLLTGWFTGDQFYTRSGQPPTVFVQHRLWAFIGTGTALLLLLLRVKARDELPDSSRYAAIALALAGAAMIGYTGYLGGQMVFAATGRHFGPDTEATPAPTATAQATPTRLDPTVIVKGKELYNAQDCRTCHRIAGKGGKQGPELTHEGTRRPDLKWQVEHLKNPEKLVPGSSMPAYNKLPEADLKAIATYVLSLK